MDYSAAQMNGHAEEYADAVISTITSFSTLSAESQAIERARYVKEAREVVRGCATHFNGSTLRIKRNGNIVPSGSADHFQSLINELLAKETTLAAFDQAVEELKAEFPAAEGWLMWWLRPRNAMMIFPIKSKMDLKLQKQLPKTSNPVEHQHSLLHRSNGVDQDLVSGIKKLHLNVERLHDHYRAVIGTKYHHFSICIF